MLCGGTHTETVILVCFVRISEQSIIDSGSAFDLSGQTQPQCELTVRNKRQLADTEVCVCMYGRVCVCSVGGLPSQFVQSNQSCNWDFV